MKIPAPEFTTGTNWIHRMDDLPWEDPANAKMDFYILLLDAGDRHELPGEMEKALLLMTGNVEFEISGGDEAMIISAGPRTSIFDEDPWCLHAPHGQTISVKAIAPSELAIVATPNDVDFAVKMYRPEDCRSELRGKGTMQETSTRIVRTIFDKENAPRSNLVLGEVINFPGKWSSYPPHHHPQPEIYHYRFLPENGFGFSMMGDDAVQVKHGDSVVILDVVHSQTSAPGYAMYYIWPIRHLDGNPYGAEYGTPVFEEEHLWVTRDNEQAKIWKGPGSLKNN